MSSRRSSSPSLAFSGSSVQPSVIAVGAPQGSSSRTVQFQPSIYTPSYELKVAPASVGATTVQPSVIAVSPSGSPFSSAGSSYSSGYSSPMSSPRNTTWVQPTIPVMNLPAPTAATSQYPSIYQTPFPSMGYPSVVQTPQQGVADDVQRFLNQPGAVELPLLSLAAALHAQIMQKYGESAIPVANEVFTKFANQRHQPFTMGPILPASAYLPTRVPATVVASPLASPSTSIPWLIPGNNYPRGTQSMVFPSSEQGVQTVSSQALTSNPLNSNMGTLSFL